MTVYIVNYHGTIYGAFSSRDKAYDFAKGKFGESALMSLSVEILKRKVDQPIG
jgi:hypothetical protein